MTGKTIYLVMGVRGEGQDRLVDVLKAFDSRKAVFDFIDNHHYGNEYHYFYHGQVELIESTCTSESV
jgi:hypothetical protein